MSNKKGFVGGLVMMLLSIFVLLGIYFLYQKMSAKSMQNAVEKAAQSAGVDVDAKDVSPQGQVNAVRDMMGKIQDKKNAEIEKELK